MRKVTVYLPDDLYDEIEYRASHYYDGGIAPISKVIRDLLGLGSLKHSTVYMDDLTVERTPEEQEEQEAKVKKWFDELCKSHPVAVVTIGDLSELKMGQEAAKRESEAVDREEEAQADNASRR